MKIGIDLGGSHVGVGIIEDANLLISKDKIFTPEDKENIENAIVKYIDELINEVLQEQGMSIDQIEKIGVAAPGTVAGGCITSYNLGLKGFNLQAILEQKYTQPIRVKNDGKCAALAEKVYGSMKEFDDCLFMNIGTGIGGAVFIDGKLLEPKKYSGFELGHMVVNKGGRHCSCGKQGCLEAYASIKALKNKVTETLDMDSDISGQYLREELLIKDHPGVQEDLEVFLDYLTVGVCNYIDIFEPEVICFGGSFSYYEGNPILDRLIAKIVDPKNRFNQGEPPKVVTATYKNDAGIIGATL